jgi:hypothetical protein
MVTTTAVDYADECSDDTYTHVVSRVHYGMDAYFVFKNIVKNRTDINSIEATLTATINLIIASVEGNIGANLTVRQEEVLNHTTLQMFGDFSPNDPEQPLPTNLTQAYNFWLTLNETEGSAVDWWPGSSIMAVTLTPIQEIDGCIGDPTVNAIHDTLLENVNSMMDNIEHLLQIVGGLLTRDPAIRFKPLRGNLNMFKNNLTGFQLEQKRKLQSYLPNIVGGTGNGEDDLEKMLFDYENSVFNRHKSKHFLECRLRESNALDFLIANYLDASNAVVADYESANYVEYIFKKDKVLVMEFNILTPANLTEHFLSGNETDEGEFWFNNVTYNAKIGAELRLFKSFSSENLDEDDRGYLMKVSEYKTEPLFTITAFTKGAIVSDNFEIPSNPPTPTPNFISHDSFRFYMEKNTSFITGCQIFLSSFNIDGTGNEWTEIIMFSPDTATGEPVEVLISNLKPATAIRFNVHYVTEVGRSPPSEETWISTRVASPPLALAIKQVTTENVMLSWEPPEVVPERVTMALTNETRGTLTKDDFNYRVTITGEEVGIVEVV